MNTAEVPCLNWYVVHTKPKQEGRAEVNLRAWGIETLAPKLREARPARDCRDLLYRVVPLFPGYLFAHFGAAALEKVRNTRGVHSIVGFGTCATPVADSVISMVRNRIEDDGFVRLAEPLPGDRVEIIAGPLRSLSGVFERTLPARDRVVILLTTIGSTPRVQLPKAFIRKNPVSQVA